MTPGEALAQLWGEYASELDAESARRFRADVLDPFQGGDTAAVRAVAAWFAWRPKKASTARLPGPLELSRLRDGLAGLLEKVTTTKSTRQRWFPLHSSPDPLDPDAIRLLTECRIALDALSRPREPRSRLEFLAGEIDQLLTSAPDDWLPGAPLRCEARASEFLSLVQADAKAVDVARQMLLLAQQLCNGEPPQFEVAVQVTGAAAEHVNALAGRSLHLMPPEQCATCDRALDCLRRWAIAFGLEVLPRNWSFHSPPSLEALRAEGTEIAAAYRPDEPHGAPVRVKSFGIAQDEQSVRSAVVSISAGPAPAGLAELEALLTDVEHPSARALHERLRSWREASLDGTIETAAIELFVEFWDARRLDLAAIDPSMAATFSDRLSSLLRDAFGLTPFYPANFQDHQPGWAQAVGATRITTGRVREVLRPGLADRGKELRLPSRVLVE